MSLHYHRPGVIINIIEIIVFSYFFFICFSFFWFSSKISPEYLLIQFFCFDYYFEYGYILIINDERTCSLNMLIRPIIASQPTLFSSTVDYFIHYSIVFCHRLFLIIQFNHFEFVPYFSYCLLPHNDQFSNSDYSVDYSYHYHSLFLNLIYNLLQNY